MIEFLESYFSHKDDRGSIVGITNEFNIEEINLIQSKAGSVRGHHYHKKSHELFFIIEGEIEIVVQRISKDGILGEQDKFVVKENDIFFIKPYIVHTFNIIKDSKWLNALSLRHDSNNPDFYREDTN